MCSTKCWKNKELRYNAKSRIKYKIFIRYNASDKAIDEIYPLLGQSPNNAYKLELLIFFYYYFCVQVFSSLC